MHVLEAIRPLAARDPTTSGVVNVCGGASAPLLRGDGSASTRAETGGCLRQKGDRRSRPVTRMSDMGCGAKPMNLRDSRAVLGQQPGRD